jgi:hypothetical protein
MNLTTNLSVAVSGDNKDAEKGTMYMRKSILAAVAVAVASPAIASDLAVTPYEEVHRYEREAHIYEYRTAPPVVLEERAPVVRETVVVRRPVVVAPPPLVVDEYPVYSAPRVYGYADPWRYGRGYGRRFHGGW